MRAADVLEKASRDQPAILAPFKAVLLTVAAERPEQEVRWHAAQMLPCLPLTRKDTEHAVSILHGYLADRSAIVNVCALQALADLASRDRSLVPMAVVAMEAACRTGTPAMRARSTERAMAYDEAVAGGVRKAVTETGEVTEKKRFGGIAIMLRGNMGCGVVGDKLMVKVGPKGYGTALARPHPRYRLSILTRVNEEAIEACPQSWRNFDPAGPDRESIDRVIDIW